MNIYQARPTLITPLGPSEPQPELPLSYLHRKDKDSELNLVQRGFTDFFKDFPLCISISFKRAPILCKAQCLRIVLLCLLYVFVDGQLVGMDYQL